MALNVTTAVFRPGFNIATASPSLVQWDQGQMLQFEGVELPSAYQVEFTNAVTVQAITMIGNENGVEIPNELLQQSFPINAYIVLHETAEDRETEYWATIYVKARQKPREETPDPEQSSVIDQTIAALQEGVAEAQAASQAVQNMGVEAETLPEGSEATVEKTVDPETGEVTLEFGIPEGRHGATGATPDIQIGTVTTGAPGSQADASITGTREEPRLNLTIPQGPQGDAGVTSVNGKTGAVTLDASDVGAKPASYEAPVSSINGKTGAVVLDASDVGAKPASYEAPVSSVNGKTGAVVLSASDVGAKPASYEAPVSSVNEKTGAVVLDSEDIRYDSTETYSDGTVGKELGTINSALTSLSSVTEIIDTASGAIASFPDGSGLPMRSLVAQINPVQDLHGYDAPWPAGGGKNKCDGIAYDGAISSNIPRISSKTPITSPHNISTGFGGVCFFAKVESGKTYALSSDETGSSATFYWAIYSSIDDALNITNALQSGNTNVSFTAEHDGYVLFMRYNTTAGTSVTWTYAQTEVGSSATAYAPYSNICPISGWTGLQGQRTGVNVWDEEMEVGMINNDGTNGIDTARLRTKNYIKVLPGSTYYASLPGSNVLFPYYYDKFKNFVKSAPNLSGVFTIPDNCEFLRFHLQRSYGTTYNNDISINYPSTDHDYHAYTGEPISVSWQDEAGTVYGGTLDVVSGVLTVNKAKAQYTNALNSNNWYSHDENYDTWGFYSNYDSTWQSVIGLRPIGGLISDTFKTYSSMYATDNPGCSLSLSGGYMQYMAFRIPKSFIDTPSSSSDLTTKILAWLADNPIEICFDIEPIVYQLTPQEVDTLVGQNNVFVDTGNVEVTYQASIKGYIDKVLGA